MSSAASSIGNTLASTGDAYNLSQAAQDAATSDSLGDFAQSAGTSYLSSLIPGLGPLLAVAGLARTFGRGAGLTPNQYLQQELYREYPQYGDLSTFDDWLGPMGSQALARQIDNLAEAGSLPPHIAEALVRGSVEGNPNYLTNPWTDGGPPQQGEHVNPLSATGGYDPSMVGGSGASTMGARFSEPPPALSLPTPGANFPVYGTVPELNPLTAAANPNIAQDFLDNPSAPNYPDSGQVGGSDMFSNWLSELLSQNWTSDWEPLPPPQGGTAPHGVTDGQFADDSYDYNFYSDPTGEIYADPIGISDPNPDYFTDGQLAQFGGAGRQFGGAGGRR